MYSFLCRLTVELECFLQTLVLPPEILYVQFIKTMNVTLKYDQVLADKFYASNISFKYRVCVPLYKNLGNSFKEYSFSGWTDKMIILIGTVVMS